MGVIAVVKNPENNKPYYKYDIEYRDELNKLCMYYGHNDGDFNKIYNEKINEKFKKRFPNPDFILPHVEFFYLPVRPGINRKKTSFISNFDCPFLDNHRVQSNTIGIEKFIELIEKEEQKDEDGIYPPNNTRMMITRLRKIFYGSDKWDDNLIYGTSKTDIKKIKSPYGNEQHIVEIYCDENNRINSSYGKNKDWYSNGLAFKFSTGFSTPTIYRERKSYLVNGREPEILEHYTRQSVVLKDGSYIDMGHVLCGLDALNNYNNVSLPLGLAMTIDNNADAVTWVGDLGSAFAEILFAYWSDNLGNGKKDNESVDRDIMTIYNEYASQEDLLGDIDPFVIYHKFKDTQFDIGKTFGKKVSEILKEYYLKPDYQKSRFRTFAEKCPKPLTDWNGYKFSNESDWVDYYTKQINHAAGLYILVESHTAWYDVFNPSAVLTSIRKALDVAYPFFPTNWYAMTFLDALKQSIWYEKRKWG